MPALAPHDRDSMGFSVRFWAHLAPAPRHSPEDASQHCNQARKPQYWLPAACMTTRYSGLQRRFKLPPVPAGVNGFLMAVTRCDGHRLRHESPSCAIGERLTGQDESFVCDHAINAIALC